MSQDSEPLTASLKDLVVLLEANVNSIEITPRILSRYPFDYVALEIISKSFALSKACISLLEVGLPDEAYGLSRSIVECAGILRYLTIERSKQHKRTVDFTLYSQSDKSFWLYWSLQTDKNDAEMTRIQSYAEAHGIIPDPKKATQHWSGERAFMRMIITTPHPLDYTERVEKSRKMEYAVHYAETSQFVHCSQPCLDNYFPEEGIPYTVKNSSLQFKEVEERTCLIVKFYLHHVVAYALYGLNLNNTSYWKRIFHSSRNAAESSD